LKDSAMTRASSSSFSAAQEQQSRIDNRDYDSEYTQGYPGWNELVEGTLSLQRQKGGKNRIVFKSSSDSAQQIVIPVSTTEEAKIINKKTGRAKGELLIQLDCKNEAGKSIRPVFNVNNDIVRGVLE